jgi:NTP pyrophosphatase (non-canonical NTP hydrolase)
MISAIGRIETFECRECAAGKPPRQLQLDDRDDRQAAIFAWAKSAFSIPEATSLPQRGLRLLEESIEAFQACGGDEGSAQRLVSFVFSRPPGQLGQELGGVGVTVLALAAAAGMSADTEEMREVVRVLSKPIGEFTQRNKAKNKAGFLLAKTDEEP